MGFPLSARWQAEGNGARLAREGRHAGDGAGPSRRSARRHGARRRSAGSPSRKLKRRRRRSRRSALMRSPLSIGSKRAFPIRNIASNGATRCKPIARRFGRSRSIAVDTAGVLSCLTPIWQAKPETASRVRGRIERVLNAAKAERLRAGENPAAWRGHLDATLPKPGKLTRGHHAALAYADMPAFMADLRARPALAALALELAILTATRTSEVLNAQWAEFDLDAGLWTIPAERMKAPKEHRVALSKRALAIVKGLSAAQELGIRFSRPEAGQAAFQHGDANAAGPHGPARRDNLSWVPLYVFGLGVGSLALFIRASRNARWRIRSATRRKPLIGGATRWKSGGQ